MLRNSIQEHLLLIFLIITITNVSISVDAYVKENSLQSDQNNRVGHYLKSRQNGIRQLLEYSRNGIKMDVKLVPFEKNPINLTDDHFPEFPREAIGNCVYELSLGCIQKRLGKYVQDIASLDQIFLFGNNVKLVKTKVLKSHRRSDRNGEEEDIVDRSIDDFFDTFVLRITLPNWNGKAINNQIDLMFDDRNVVEGRGKGGGGGGGGGKGCKKMMMMAMGMMKMKFMGMMSLAAMKGMMMAGMSLMISKAMLMMKLMSLKGGGGGGGGGHGGGGGNGGGVWKSGGGGGGGRPSDSYGAPPSTGYGVPSSGGGGYDYSGGGGGGGGWGRSFDDRISMMNYKSDESTIKSNVDDPNSESQASYYDSNNGMVDRMIDENGSNHFDIGSISSTNLNSKNDIIEIEKPVNIQNSVYRSRRFSTLQPLIPVVSITPVDGKIN